MRTLFTDRGTIKFPCVLPVTTLGQRYSQTDNLVRPFLKHIASGAMSNTYYAQKMKPDQHPGCPLWLDSGGFALLKYSNASVKVQQHTAGGQRWILGNIVLPDENQDSTQVITPSKVLSTQSRLADVALTLDLPCPPSLERSEANRRIELSKTNALWAKNYCQTIPLYAVIPVWDISSSVALAKCYTEAQFDGIAIGGLIPRLRDIEFVIELVKNIRNTTNLPLHALGIGTPSLIKLMFELGIDSTDSSSYVKHAANGKCWSNPNAEFKSPSPLERRDMALLNLITATQASSNQTSTLFQSWNLTSAQQHSNE
ncbi:tRNA-guanine transglycosylase [Leptolyngbya sp. AN03gr2]|uniref:tRNA-guanine transglycosylase n=1 Tax=unclassified Leptolyngbya TaxID=2650499 RepID=UPI003D324150